MSKQRDRALESDAFDISIDFWEVIDEEYSNIEQISKKLLFDQYGGKPYTKYMDKLLFGEGA